MMTLWMHKGRCTVFAQCHLLFIGCNCKFSSWKAWHMSSSWWGKRGRACPWGSGLATPWTLQHQDIIRLKPFWHQAQNICITATNTALTMPHLDTYDIFFPEKSSIKKKDSKMPCDTGHGKQALAFCSNQNYLFRT